MIPQFEINDYGPEQSMQMLRRGVATSPTGRGVTIVVAGAGVTATELYQADIKVSDYASGKLAIEAAIALLTPGRTWIDTIRLIGNFTNVNGVLLPSYTQIQGPATVNITAGQTTVFESGVGADSYYIYVDGITFVSANAGGITDIALDFFDFSGGLWWHPVNSKVTNCNFIGFATGIMGILEQSEISSCFFDDIYYNGIEIQGSRDLFIDKNIFRIDTFTSRAGMYIIDAYETSVTNCNFAGNTSTGGTTGLYLRPLLGLSVKGCTLSALKTAEIYYEPRSGTTGTTLISDCYFRVMWSTATTAGIVLANNGSTDINILTIKDSYFYDMPIGILDGISANNNYYNLTIEGNTFVNNTSYNYKAFAFNSATSTIQMYDNTFLGFRIVPTALGTIYASNNKDSNYISPSELINIYGSLSAGTVGNAVMAWQNPNGQSMMVTGRTRITAGATAAATGAWGLATTVQVVENCEDVWTVTAPAARHSTCAVDTTYVERGTNDIAITATAGVANADILAWEQTAATLDLSTVTHITLKFRSNVALNAGDISIALDQAADFGTPIAWFTLPAILANTTTLVVINLNGGAAAGAGYNSIDSIGIRVNDVTRFVATKICYLDDIRGITVGTGFVAAANLQTLGNASYMDATPIHVDYKNNDDATHHDTIVMVSAANDSTGLFGSYYVNGQGE